MKATRDASPGPWPPEGGNAGSIALTRIETAKLNGLDPQAWLTDVLHRTPEQPHQRIASLELLAR